MAVLYHCNQYMSRTKSKNFKVDVLVSTSSRFLYESKSYCSFLFFINKYNIWKF